MENASTEQPQGTVASNVNPAIVQNTQPQTPKKNNILLILLVAVGIVLLGGAIYYITQAKSQNSVNSMQGKDTADTSGTVEAFASEFADYKEFEVDVNPSVPAYKVSSDLSNIENKDQFNFPADWNSKIAQNGFVVSKYGNDEFYPVYESNRYSYTPSFVTTDSMLHNYHLVFDHILKQVEEKYLISDLNKLSKQMLADSLAQYEKLKGTEFENAAKRNVGFFAVGAKLVDPSVNVPNIVSSEVNSELAKISAHQGVAESAVMNIGTNNTDSDGFDTPQGNLSPEASKEDYSQYVPRGHYTKSEDLKKYFNSMMWFGRLTFRFKNDDEIKSALLVTAALDKSENKTIWNRIYEPVNFFVGKSDDITYYQLTDVASKIYGNTQDVNSLIDANKFASFKSDLSKLEPPQINSMPIFNSDIQPDREAEIKGFRFMGQRFTIDAAIFQRLVDREVTDRMLPKGLDIPAAMGSKEALNILTEMGETTKYPEYSQNMNKMKTYIDGLPKDTWTQNLYWGWLYSLKPLTEEKTAGYPSFMTNQAWVRKELNTYLGSWTELKHDTILYAKQVYAEMGGSGPEEQDDRGYVEPNPYVYARLASLLDMTSRGLDSRHILDESSKDNLNKMKELALKLKVISEKELNNQNLNEEDYELIRSYGGQLEHFWLEVNKEEIEKAGISAQNYLSQNPAALIADVATDPNGSALEEATGQVMEIYVVVPIEGKLRLTKGAVYSYYEFIQPISERLTDEAWREMITNGQIPDAPSWTSDFQIK